MVVGTLEGEPAFPLTIPLTYLLLLHRIAKVATTGPETADPSLTDALRETFTRRHRTYQAVMFHKYKLGRPCRDLITDTEAVELAKIEPSSGGRCSARDAKIGEKCP